jgi:hypothetical protein
MIRTGWRAAIWLFVLYVAFYDGYFAWLYRDHLPAWEMNPLARWMAAILGLQGLLGFKAVGLLFAFALAAYCRLRQNGLEKWLTCVAGGAYLILFLHYSVDRLSTQECYGVPTSRLLGAPPAVVTRASSGSLLSRIPAFFLPD